MQSQISTATPPYEDKAGVEEWIQTLGVCKTQPHLSRPSAQTGSAQELPGLRDQESSPMTHWTHALPSLQLEYHLSHSMLFYLKHRILNFLLSYAAHFSDPYILCIKLSRQAPNSPK